MPELRSDNRAPSSFLLGLLILSTLVFSHSNAYAYIGPGAGFAFLSSFFVFFLAFILAFVALFSWPFRYILRFLRKRSRSQNAITERVVIVGLDGLDPTLLEQFAEEGSPPNFVKLRNQGMYCRLQTTLPALSPVAWSTFQTGVNPGKHNIFDFLHRNPKTYLGELSSARIRPASRSLKIGRFKIPLSKPEMSLLRKSQPFWRILGEHGIFSLIQRVPVTFPPEKFRGISLSAMCVPDLLGTQGTFTYYTTHQEAPTIRTGGHTIHVQWNRDIIKTCVIGPHHPFSNPSAPMKIPLIIERKGSTLSLKILGRSYSLRAKMYSPWIRIYFRAGLKIRGIVRFYLHETEPNLSLYMTPIHLDPESPSLPISHPAIYSIYLAKKHGSFATLGLAEDTWALNEGALDDSSFIEQCNLIHAERESMFFDALTRIKKGLLVCVFDITDRIQHMFWRYHDPHHPARDQSPGNGTNNATSTAYKNMDTILGRIMERIDNQTWLFVISDYGFKSFRTGINVNTWLYQNGYLYLEEKGVPGQWFHGVDWTRTRAFALGLGGLFINQEGRDHQGIVAPGEETQELKRELREKFKCLRDPQTAEIAIIDVYDSNESYLGPYRENAPDLIIGYNEGYRASWESVIGQVTDKVFCENPLCWSGDHCIDPKKVPGVFFVNKNIPIQRAGIVDIAPTILTLFGIPPPDYMDGKPLDCSLPS